LSGAGAVTTPSRYLLEQMREYRSDLILLPNALEISAYEFRPRTAPQPSLMWLRSFHEMYNPSLAVKVTALLAEEFPDVRLTMVGPDKGDGSLQRVRRTAEELGITGRIETPGGVPKRDVPTWLNRGDVFLNTTNVDNTPVSVIEAGACGLCVVSTNVGGLPYLLDHEQDALLVPPNDAKAMADAVRRVLKEPGLAECLSRAARAKAEGFDWSVVLPRWEALLEEVAQQAG
jgi:glycosyltransferase involved in cell wall biosynthesis